MKKSLLIVAMLVVGLIGAGLFAGCSSGGSSTTTTASATTSSTSEDTTASVTSTSTTVEETSTETTGSPTTTEATPTTAAVKAKRYEQNDSHIVYSGTWKTSANAAASGGTFKYADSAGAKVTITFEGTHLSLIAKTSSKYGKAMITMDGKKLGTIDLYSVDAKYQRKVWGTGTLKPGTHTVVIAWTGTKRGAAVDTNINIDCVLVTGTLQ